MQRRAREDETRHEIGLLALHDPPEEPVTRGELATSLTRATLAKDLETQLVRQLGKKDRTSTPHLQKVAGQVSAHARWAHPGARHHEGEICKPA